MAGNLPPTLHEQQLGGCAFCDLFIFFERFYSKKALAMTLRETRVAVYGCPAAALAWPGTI